MGRRKIKTEGGEKTTVAKKVPRRKKKRGKADDGGREIEHKREKRCEKSEHQNPPRPLKGKKQLEYALAVSQKGKEMNKNTIILTSPTPP